jgi:hypothetical protein
VCLLLCRPILRRAHDFGSTDLIEAVSFITELALIPLAKLGALGICGILDVAWAPDAAEALNAYAAMRYGGQSDEAVITGSASSNT